ncbi:hypothetical protein CLF_100609 [Clonorchis sinensis]|uniref:Uncharacterized protein n=1 Tax=Clonorchis sinensis TaxID=79923 RepID=G7Y3U7_CLOSI|nr:hypothetical protein CLF_100609 [Clonorchis sinensis]
MFTLRIAFPSVVRSSRFIVFEWSIKGPVSELTWEGLISKLCDHTKTKRGKFYVSWHADKTAIEHRVSQSQTTGSHGSCQHSDFIGVS